MQWFPGHMKKAMREIERLLPVIDVFIVLLDARAPFSSFNEEFNQFLTKQKTLFIFTKKDLSDQARLDELKTSLTVKFGHFLIADLKKRVDINKIRKLLNQQKLANSKLKRRLRMAVLGVPNVGKSTFINALANKKSTRIGNQPGITRHQQWINLQKVQILDTPGILWPQVSDETTATKLTLIGAVRYEIAWKEEFVFNALKFLKKNYFFKLQELEIEKVDLSKGATLFFDNFAAKKHMLTTKGAFDSEKAVKYLANKLQRIKGVTFD